VDECASDPCMNDGSCDDEIDSYRCNCVDGYTGHMCNIGRVC